MNGSGLKRKEPEQAVVCREGTAPAGQQPVVAQGLEEAPPLPAQQMQQPKKHKAPHLDHGMQGSQQLSTQPEQHLGQQEPAHQQRAPLAASRQQQLEQPPIPPRQQQDVQQDAASGLRAEQQAWAAPTVAQRPPQRAAAAAAAPTAMQRAPPMRHQGTVLQQQTSQQHHAQQPPRPPAQQQQPLIQQQPAQALPLPQPLGLPPTQAVPWQQPPAVWPSAAAALGWPPQPPQQLWQQQHTQQQQQQTLPTWDPCMGPAWDPVLQQWTTAEPALQQHAQQHAQQPQHQQWPSRATAPPPSHPGLGWQSQAAALQQQLSAQQQGMLPPDQPQAAGQGQHATKLQRDVPPGGPAEALLRLAVRICCQRLGPGEHDGKQLGKVLEELDRNWRTSTCGGHSVTVLLKELDRRGLVVAREDTSGGKRICYFRNIAC